jgi:hypothetical protein
MTGISLTSRWKKRSLAEIASSGSHQHLRSREGVQEWPMVEALPAEGGSAVASISTSSRRVI